MAQLPADPWCSTVQRKSKDRGGTGTAVEESRDSRGSSLSARWQVGKVSFDDLSPSEFEEFCFDLLKHAGYVNVDWRKGTPRPSSPADQGRDIEAILERTDLDQFRHHERWNVDAKHYARGVPPESFESLMTWSWATRPNVALVVVSGFLSNPAKAWIREYIENSRPPFRIRYWERPTLQTLVERFPELIDRHNLIIEPARRRIEIEHVRREYEDIVWYERIQRSLDWVGDPTTEITPQTQQRLDAIEQRYPRSELYPWSDRAGEINRGRLSALRWVMGEDWKDSDEEFSSDEDGKE
jgi:hypothetical protein